jgi:antitoxin MazE
LPHRAGHGIFIVDTFRGVSEEISVTTTIQKWGNSLALRIPKAVARDVPLKNGSTVNLAVRGGKMIVEPAPAPKYHLDDLLKGVSKKNIHRSVDTGPATGQEVW